MRDVNSFNKVILIGRLGQDPELRYIPQTDRAVANFSLATNERLYNPNSGEGDMRTEWHRIVVWGKLAEFCQKYMTKGKQVLIEGRLRTEKWQDRDGNQRSTTKIHAEEITLLGRREDTQGSGGGGGFPDEFGSGSGGSSGIPRPKTENTFPEPRPDDDDDVPF